MPTLRIATERPDDWRALRALTLYRLLLITLLLTLLETGVSLEIFEQVNAGLFRRINQAYALASLLLVLPLLYRRPPLGVQMALQFGVDLLGITALVYSTGGIEAGLGILLVTPLVAASLIYTPRYALVCAAAGTLMMFGEEFLRQFTRPLSPAELTSTGVLGLMLFATSLATSLVAARARRSEALAARAGSEVADLSRLNQRILESMTTGVLVVDASGYIRSVNAAARRLLGTDAAVGRALNEVGPGLARAVADWRSGHSQADRPLQPGPEGVEVQPRFSRLGWDADSPLLILLDDTAALREQARQLKLAALGRLSASIAHEIRNPLAAMLHASQLLNEDESLSPEQRRLLAMIVRHGGRIERIVRDVLGIARREPQTRQSLALCETLQSIRQGYLDYPAHTECRIELGPCPAHWRVSFDPEHLQQVLHNLWDNSFGHAQGRAVTVRLTVERIDGRITLEVRDDGPGIPLNLQERIFEPFVTGAARGTGLGLYLARELCELNAAQLQHLPSEAGAVFRLVFSSAS